MQRRETTMSDLGDRIEMYFDEQRPEDIVLYI